MVVVVVLVDVVPLVVVVVVDVVPAALVVFRRSSIRLRRLSTRFQ